MNNTAVVCTLDVAAEKRLYDTVTAIARGEVRKTSTEKLGILRGIYKRMSGFEAFAASNWDVPFDQIASMRELLPLVEGKIRTIERALEKKK